MRAVDYLEHAEGRVEVMELGDGRRRVTVIPRDPAQHVSVRSWETRYPLDLIRAILEVKGIAWVGDEIQRDEDPRYVQPFLRYGMLSYLPESAFEGKRLLDFGCGSGASAMVLGRMFPRTEIVGVELDENLVALAELRRRHYGFDHVKFEVSPDPSSLPANIGMFDFVSLSAVWEHLLPAERRTLVPKIWSTLNVGGVLFLNQTPHRWYLIEDHTTGLPLLNFAPRPIVHWAANRYSRRLAGNESWEELLRAGIRGGTQREVMRVVRATNDGRPVFLERTRLGVRDSVDHWYACSQEVRPMRIKRVMRAGFKVINRITGSAYAPGIDLAIEKCAR
jgi:2-polyprenyl-3-methyl-5-hydroxy-6-metoxy-1,4-benzoquinol methylase